MGDEMVGEEEVMLGGGDEGDGTQTVKDNTGNTSIDGTSRKKGKKGKSKRKSDKTVGQEKAEDEYVVERIVGKKLIDTDKGKEMYYHIKWKGWAPLHNTWEPIENLDGCQKLLDQFENELKEKRKAKREAAGLAYNSEEEDEKENFFGEESRAKTKRELLEYGVETEWPSGMIPLELLAVLTVDRHLCYIVRHQGIEDIRELNSENCVLIRAEPFRLLFPHVVIAYYEKNLVWVTRAEVGTELKEKAEAALAAAKESKQRKELAMAEGGPSGDTDEDDDLDDNGNPLPKITIKKGIDLFGLPDNMGSSSISSISSSSSEDDFEEVKIQTPLAHK